ncbi:MAG: alpha/beta hydrolase [Victivallales bacterium]|nr:alpha/beta hydrolase [Victivallales bacterium]
MKTMLLFSRFWNTVLCVMLAVCCVHCMAAEEPKKDTAPKTEKKPDYTEFLGLVYDEQKQLKYDLYLPTAKVPKDTPVGAILFIHGGGWQKGDRKHKAWYCKHYAGRGFVTATISYSFIKETGNSVSFFTMMDEIQKCLEHMRDTAAKHHYPIKCLAVSGSSAGGHLAMMYAYSRAKTSPIPIAMVFQEVGPSFFTKGCLPLVSHLELTLVQRGAGVAVTQEDYESGKAMEAVKSISPAFLVTDETVPTVAAYGGKDFLVTKAHMEKLRSALEAHKIPHEIMVFPNSTHTLKDDPKLRKQYFATIVKFLEKYMK